MGDFIGSAPPNQILFLMSIPCVGALLLLGFIGFSLNRRTKKSEMKLGILPKSEAPPSDNNKPVSQTAPPPQISASLQTQSNSELDLGIISKNTNTLEKSMNAENDQKLDLAARLQNFVSPPVDDPPTLPNQHEMLRLLRDPQSGQLIIEVGDKQYFKLADVSDKQVGQYILELTAHLLAFTNGMVVTQNGIKSLPVPQIGDLPKPVPNNRATPSQPPLPQTVEVSTPPPTAASKDVEETLLSSLRANLSEAEKPQKSGFFRIPRPVSQPSNLPALNLADEINDIVQDRLRSSSLEQDNQITISSDPAGGIRINVNNHYYSSPDEISDPAIRDLIKSSIKEWERR